MNFCAFLYGFGPDSLFFVFFPPYFPLPFLWQGWPPFRVEFYKKRHKKIKHSAPLYGNL